MVGVVSANRKQVLATGNSGMMVAKRLKPDVWTMELMQGAEISRSYNPNIDFWIAGEGKRC
jgi:hypothetical protein